MTDSRGPFCRVEHHMSTVITLTGTDIYEVAADSFFDSIQQLEDVLSRFREGSDISRVERGELAVDRADPAVRVVLDQCIALRKLTDGDFDHEPRRRTGNPCHPVLDANAFAKGWIIDEAATVLRMTATEFLVNGGGDIVASGRPDGRRWRIGIQHPVERTAILGTLHLAQGAVATSGTYERGGHIRVTGPSSLMSVTVVGPDLGQADALSTAVYASSQSPPAWWAHVDPAYGLLTLCGANRLRWLPPRAGNEVEWSFPAGSNLSREEPGVCAVADRLAAGAPQSKSQGGGP